jgi:hypothetical protein
MLLTMIMRWQWWRAGGHAHPRDEHGLALAGLHERRVGHGRDGVYVRRAVTLHARQAD